MTVLLGLFAIILLAWVMGLGAWLGWLLWLGTAAYVVFTPVPNVLVAWLLGAAGLVSIVVQYVLILMGAGK